MIFPFLFVLLDWIDDPRSQTLNPKIQAYITNAKILRTILKQSQLFEDWVKVLDFGHCFFNDVNDLI